MSEKECGVSIHVGVEEFDDSVYGSLRNTTSCVKDAQSLAALANICGFQEQIFAGNVKLKDVRNAVIRAAAMLHEGDYFLLTFDGHGFPKYFPQPRAWCFSDAKIDRDHAAHSTDSIEAWLRAFDPKVRILVIANCCFAADPRDFEGEAKPLTLPRWAVERVASLDPRFHPKSVFRFLLSIFKMKPLLRPQFGAHVYELAACGPTKTARDGTKPSEMSPFAKEVHALASLQTHASFGDFMTMLEKACRNSRIEEPFLTPYDVTSTDYDKHGPYYVIR